MEMVKKQPMDGELFALNWSNPTRKKMHSYDFKSQNI